MKKLVYICSPCRGDYEKNIDNAAAYSRAAFTRGYIPITPHLYFARFMDDTNCEERSMAMDAGLQLLLMCSEVWVFGLDHPSEGMQAEIAHAIRHGIPVVDGMTVIAAKAPEAPVKPKTSPDGFVSLREIFERAGVKLVPVRKEGAPCQNAETMKGIKILPHGKR